MSKPGSFGAGEEQPHAVICPSNLFRRGGEDALLQPEGLCWQRLPQLVSRQAGLELQRQEAMSSDGGTWPCIPQPTSPHLVHGLLRPLGVAAIGLRHVAHRQRHRLERVIPVRQSGVSRCCCTQGSSPRSCPHRHDTVSEPTQQQPGRCPEVQPWRWGWPNSGRSRP